MRQTELYTQTDHDLSAPLAARVRPRKLADFYGQQHLIGAGKPLRQCVDMGTLHSMILWGPPGTGKTTLARLLADSVEANWVSLSAVLAGVKDVRRAIEQAEISAKGGKETILFIDEVHRFNKAQQDAFLPHVEKGTVIFIGATTENPSFEVNNALLSRARVYVLKPFNVSELRQILRRALTDETAGLGGRRQTLLEEDEETLIAAAEGDARRLLNLLDLVSQLSEEDSLIETETIRQVAAGGVTRFDKQGDLFYQQISALHKAVRGSSPDAALYWLCRMLAGGCDSLYIARRVLRMASEDIGNADPRALSIALDAWETFQRLGSPEGELGIAQAVVYLASTAKSNAVYEAFNQARQHVAGTPDYEVPLRFRNASTTLMKNLGYGSGYRYAHDEEGSYASGESYFPDELDAIRYYDPPEQGLERKIRARLESLRQADTHHKKS